MSALVSCREPIQPLPALLRQPGEFKLNSTLARLAEAARLDPACDGFPGQRDVVAARLCVAAKTPNGKALASWTFVARSNLKQSSLYRKVTIPLFNFDRAAIAWRLPADERTR